MRYTIWGRVYSSAELQSVDNYAAAAAAAVPQFPSTRSIVHSRHAMMPIAEPVIRQFIVTLYGVTSYSLAIPRSEPRDTGLNSSRKLHHTRFRFVPKSTTLNDLERSFRTVFQNTCVFRAHHENLNGPILSAAKMSLNDYSFW